MKETDGCSSWCCSDGSRRILLSLLSTSNGSSWKSSMGGCCFCTRGNRVLHTTPPRQSLYLQLSSRLSKRQKAQERLYDKLPQQSLVTSRTGMLIDFVHCQVWRPLFVVKSSSSLALFWLLVVLPEPDTRNSCTLSRSTFCSLNSCGFQSRRHHHPLANIAPVLTPTLANGGH